MAQQRIHLAKPKAEAEPAIAGALLTFGAQTTETAQAKELPVMQEILSPEMLVAPIHIAAPPQHNTVTAPAKRSPRQKR